MSERPHSLERGIVQTRRAGSGLWNDRWIFLLAYPSGEGILRSPEFKSHPDGVRDGTRERQAFEAFMPEVHAADWRLVARPSPQQPWWEYRFARGSDQDIQNEIYKLRMSPLSVPQQTGGRGGMGRSAWWMWGITIAIVIGLFACCVILVLTAEVRLTPVR